jgi:hypothetical protein
MGEPRYSLTGIERAPPNFVAYALDASGMVQVFARYEK